MRRIRSNLLAIFSLAFMLLAGLPGAARAAAGVVLDVQPKPLDLFLEGEADLTLLVQNDLAVPITPLSLDISGTAGVQVDPQPALPAAVEAGTSAAVPVHVRRSANGYASGSLVFRLAYEWSDAGKTAPKSSVAVVKLDIQERQVPAIDKLIALKVETPVKVLGENQEGLVIVSLQNLSAYPLTLESLEAGGVRYITAAPREATSNVAIAPRSTESFAFGVTLKSPYQIGDEVLVFDARIRWAQDGREFTGSQQVSKTIPIGVVTEQSDLLKLLGMPTYLLLPGFLVMIAFGFCWKRFSPKADLGLTPTNVEFWVLTITLSIPLIVVYRGYAALVGLPSRFPDTFGLADILRLWVISLLLGVLFWWLILLVRKALKREIPLPEDTPLSILRKLELNKSGIYLWQADYNNTRFAIFPPVKDEPGKVWLLPFIHFEFTPAAPVGTQSAISAILDRTAGERSIDTPQGAEDIRKALKDAMRAKHVVVEWANGDQPLKVEDSKVTRISRIALVQEQVWPAGQD